MYVECLLIMFTVEMMIMFLICFIAVLADGCLSSDKCCYLALVMGFASESVIWA